MDSRLAIINAALVLLGEAPLQSLNSGSKYALIANTFWSGSLNAVLRGHPWNFAARRVALAVMQDVTTANGVVKNVPPFGFANAFALPADCVRVLEVSAAAYKIEGRKVLCDDPALNLRYISNAVPIAEWDAICSEALAIYLSWKMAYPITKSAAVKDAMWGSYVQILAQARTVDAQEEPMDSLQYDNGTDVSDLLSVRS